MKSMMTRKEFVSAATALATAAAYPSAASGGRKKGMKIKQIRNAIKGGTA